MPSVLVPLPGRAGRPPDRATPRRSSRPAPRCSCPTPSSTRARLDADARRAARRPGAPRAMGDGGARARPPRRRRALRRPRRGGGPCRDAERAGSHARRSTSTAPARGAHRRRRRRGMSAIASVLARMGHRVSGSDLRDSRALDAPRGCSASTRHVGHAADNLPADADAVVISTAIPERNPEVVAAPRARHPGAAPRRRARARSSRRAAPIAVAGSHGKTTTSSMLALILRAAGWHPSFVDRRRRQRGRHQRGVRRRRVARRRGRRERRHVPRARRPRPPIVTSVEPDHLDHYGDFAALVAAFERVRRRACPGRVCVCADDDGRARGIARATRRGTSSPTASPTTPTTASSTYAGGRGGTRSRSCATASRSAIVELPVPGRHNAANAAGAAAMALELGVPFDAVAARARAASAGSRAASSSAASATASPSSTTTRTSPSEVAAMIRRRARRRLAPGRRGVPAAPLLAHRVALARLRRRVRRRRRASCSPTCTRRRAAAARRVGPAGRARGARRPPRARRSCTSRAAPTSSRTCPRLAAARRPRAHPRRRRPHHRCPTSGWRRGREPRRARRVGAALAARLAGRGRARRARSPTSPPTASAARSRSLVARRHADELAALAAVRAPSDVPPVLVVGRGSNLLVADAGFAGRRASCSTGEFERDRPRRPGRGVVRAGGAVRAPGARPARRGGRAAPGSSSTWGSRAASAARSA